MNQLTGKINSLIPRKGYTPSFDIQLEISNADPDEQVIFVWALARVAISFISNTTEMPSRGDAVEIGIAVPKHTLPHFRTSATTTFQLPFDEHLRADIEKERQGRDVAVYLSVNFGAIVKSSKNVAGSQELPQGGAIADPKYGGQDVLYIIPRSQWEEIIDRLGLSNVDRQKQLEEYERQGKQTLENLKATLEAAKEAAKLVGIVEHAKVFQEEANNHRRSAIVWLASAIILALLAGGVAVWNLIKAEHFVSVAISEESSQSSPQSQNPQNKKTPDSKADGLIGLQIQLAIAKIVVLSILLTVSIWAGRVYRAHRHNFVVNRHRSNALTTFQTFALGTSDDQIKNAVLLQATTCIFGPQSTGYISDEKDTDSYPQILEIIRGVGATGK